MSLDQRQGANTLWQLAKVRFNRIKYTLILLVLSLIKGSRLLRNFLLFGQRSNKTINTVGGQTRNLFPYRNYRGQHRKILFNVTTKAHVNVRSRTEKVMFIVSPKHTLYVNLYPSLTKKNWWIGEVLNFTCTFVMNSMLSWNPCVRFNCKDKIYSYRVN